MEEEEVVEEEEEESYAETDAGTDDSITAVSPTPPPPPGQVEQGWMEGAAALLVRVAQHQRPLQRAQSRARCGWGPPCHRRQRLREKLRRAG